MKVYSLDVKVWATAYIKANNEEEALRKAKTLAGAYINEQDGIGEVEISGLSYNNPELPEISLSPAMTIGEIEDDRLDHIQFVEELKEA